jgi:hypothetical protein
VLGIRTRVRTKLSPSSWIYLLVHTLIFFGGVSLLHFDGPIMLSVATSLMATGIAGWVIFFWVRQNETSARSLQNIANLGLTDAFAFRSVAIRAEYEPRFGASRNQISIMGFGLRALREDFGGQFPNWARATKVRILVLDPTAPVPDRSYADQRDAEEDNPIGSIRNDIQALLGFTRTLRAQYPDSFQIRLYTCMPNINVCIIDDEAFWGPYMYGQQSRNTMTLLCRRGGHMYMALADHFEQIWTSPAMSRPAPDD